jgi:hypothetical protein
MNMTNGAVARVAGEVAAGTIGKINPNPVEHFRPLVADPLSGLATPDSYLNDPQSGAVLPTINMASTGTGICKSQDPCILPPGKYPGGIAAGGGSGPSTLLLRPGVYYVGGGGMKLKSASARILAIPGASVMTDAVAKTTFAKTLTADVIGTAWQAACPLNGTSCGVLIYNAPTKTNSWVTTGGNADQISNGSQGMLMLRAYKPIAGNAVPFMSYENLVFWQARTPVPTQSSGQPDISMSGGACVVVSGTVYAPGGRVDFGGSTCGTGGGGDAVSALQFIVWDLAISGNNTFYFAYQKDYFASPYVYGLVE